MAYFVEGKPLEAGITSIEFDKLFRSAYPDTSDNEMREQYAFYLRCTSPTKIVQNDDLNKPEAKKMDQPVAESTPQVSPVPPETEEVMVLLSDGTHMAVGYDFATFLRVLRTERALRGVDTPTNFIPAWWDEYLAFSEVTRTEKLVTPYLGSSQRESSESKDVPAPDVEVHTSANTDELENRLRTKSISVDSFMEDAAKQMLPISDEPLPFNPALGEVVNTEGGQYQELDAHDFVAVDGLEGLEDVMGQVEEKQKEVIKGIDQILAERHKQYGAFSGHAKISQDLKEVMRATPRWARLSPMQRESLEMDAHKTARILNGDPDFLDSWVDKIGYIQLVVNDLKSRLHLSAKAGSTPWGEVKHKMSPERRAQIKQEALAASYGAAVGLVPDFASEDQEAEWWSSPEGQRYTYNAFVQAAEDGTLRRGGKPVKTKGESK